MIKYLLILSIFSFNLIGFGRELSNFNQFWEVLTQLESSNNPKAVGDNGLAIGIAQIHRVYWQDSGVPGKYEQCFDINYSKKIVYAYLLRYSKTDNFEEWARLHNGGCNWKKKKGQAKKNLDSYWAKFSVIMFNERNNIKQKSGSSNR